MAQLGEEQVGCRTPAEGRDGVTNIPKWKFDLIRGHILDILSDGQARVYNDVRDEVGARLTEDEAARLGGRLCAFPTGYLPISR